MATRRLVGNAIATFPDVVVVEFSLGAFFIEAWITIMVRLIEVDVAFARFAVPLQPVWATKRESTECYSELALKKIKTSAMP